MKITKIFIKKNPQEHKGSKGKWPCVLIQSGKTSSNLTFPTLTEETGKAISEDDYNLAFVMERMLLVGKTFLL